MQINHEKVRRNVTVNNVAHSLNTKFNFLSLVFFVLRCLSKHQYERWLLSSYAYK